MVKGAWCNSRLKVNAMRQALNTNIREDVLSYTNQKITGERGSDLRFSNIDRSRQLVHGSEDGLFSSSATRGANINTVQYLGIASDEPKRIERHINKKDIVLPLVDIGWDEAYCRQWCEENNLLSPIYTDSMRGGCWFCHNQGIDHLRILRHNYPELWELLLKWDSDSPTTFKPNGRTVHDFEKRFQMEDDGLIKAGDTRFRWKKILT